MSKSEVLKIMGHEPAADVVRPDGTESLVWVHNTGLHHNIASFILRDGNVISIPGEIASNRVDFARQLAKPLPPPEKTVDPAAEQKRNEERDKTLNFLREQREREEARAAQVLKDYLASHPHLSQQAKDCILANKICLGMTTEDVFISWGAPGRKSTSVGRFGRSEQWSYHDSTFLFFDNGVLTGWNKNE